MKMTKEQIKYKYTKVILFFIIGILLMFVLWSYSDNSSVEISCSINGIYWDYYTDNCYSIVFNNTGYCPLPQNIECSGEINQISGIILGLIK